MFRGIRSHFLIARGKESGHSEQLRTDAQLQTGPAPDRIDRPMDLRLGYIGPNYVNAFPMTGGLLYVGHVPTVQIRRGPTLTPGNAIDDTAPIGAIFAGNPVQ